MNKIYLLVVGIFVAFLSACARPPAGTGNAGRQGKENIAPTPASRIAELNEFDFRAGLPQLERGSLSPYETNETLRLEPAEREALRPLLKRDEAGWSTDFTMTGVRCTQFYFREGRVPVNAMELFPELKTEAGYQDFMAMEPQERLERYADGVNRVTGRFYRSFSRGWSPGEFVFELIPLDERVQVKEYKNGQKLIFKPEDEQLLTKPYFRFMVYSIAQDQVAFENRIAPDYSDMPEGTLERLGQ